MKARTSINKFNFDKITQTKMETKSKTEAEKRMIYKYERQAQELENEEEELLQRLKDIQQEEKDTFNELEQAMIAASLAKKDRLDIVDEESFEQGF